MMTRRRILRTRRLPAAWLVGSLVAVSASTAAAEPGVTEKATAEALFQQAAELMTEKQFAAACDKFAASEQLDPALGTLLRLADCNDRIGKTASAWAMFKEGGSLARTRGEAERQRLADERAAELEKRLSKLELKVDSKNLVPGFELKLNGVAIPRASWDTPVPVDPGRQRLEASAPGRATWSGTAEVPEGPSLRSVEVPALTLKAVDPTAPIAGISASNATPSRESPSSPGATQRTFGYVTGALGVVGLALGGYLGYRAYDSNRDSLAQCRVEDVNACTPAGKDMRDDAKGFAFGSTVAVAAGGALLAGGLVLVLSARGGEPRHATDTSLRIAASSYGLGPGIKLEGAW